MRKSTRLALAIVGVPLIGLSAFTFGQQGRDGVRTPARLPTMSPNTQPPTHATSIAMQAKLAASQKLIEGLTTGNFNVLAKASEDLRNVCDSDAWSSHENAMVTHYRAELRRASEKLVQHSEEHNLDGAAYAYMNALTTCINCHQYARDVLRIAAVPPGPVVSIPVTEAESSATKQRYAPMLR